MLHMFTNILDNLGFYLSHDLISIGAAQKVHAQQQQAVKDLLPNINDCVEALGVFNIPELNAPISRDFIAFNDQKDMDDCKAAGKMFDFRQGATKES